MIIDEYIMRDYNDPSYNCWDFTRDVWMDLTNFDIGDRTPIPPSSISIVKRINRQKHEFEKLLEPLSPSIVLMKITGKLPHIGVYIKGKILHLTDSVAKYESISSLQINVIEMNFYRCKL